MNKKLKAFISLAIVIQLLVPSFLLVHHYSVLSTAKQLETEYTFEISRIYFNNYYFDYTEGAATLKQDGPMEFDTDAVISWGNKKIKVIASPQNNVIDTQELKSGETADSWFYSKYYRQNSVIDAEKYSFEPGVNGEEIKAVLRREYSILKDKEDREPAYLTAKIYKGLFLPTAIYFKGEKIIDINL